MFLSTFVAVLRSHFRICRFQNDFNDDIGIRNFNFKIFKFLLSHHSHLFTVAFDEEDVATEETQTDQSTIENVNDVADNSVNLISDEDLPLPNLEAMHIDRGKYLI